MINSKICQQNFKPKEVEVKKSLGSKALIFPSPVWCIGSYDANDRPNVMTAAWAGICCFWTRFFTQLKLEGTTASAGTWGGRMTSARLSDAGEQSPHAAVCRVFRHPMIFCF